MLNLVNQLFKIYFRVGSPSYYLPIYIYNMQIITTCLYQDSPSYYLPIYIYNMQIITTCLYQDCKLVLELGFIQNKVM